MFNKLSKYGDEFRRWLRKGDYEFSDGGVLLHSSALLKGTYFEKHADGEVVPVFSNLLPGEGIASILDVALGARAKYAGFYLAPFANAVNPAANWTAANFAATAGEITSLTEGYSETTRPLWEPAATAGGVVGNLDNLAVFSIVCTSTLNISGIGLLSSDVRGGTGGVLVSAGRYPSVRVVNNGDGFTVGYTVSLTDS